MQITPNGIKWMSWFIAYWTSFKQRKKASVFGSGSQNHSEEGSQINVVSKLDSAEGDRVADQAINVEAGDEFETLMRYSHLAMFLKLRKFVEGRDSGLLVQSRLSRLRPMQVRMLARLRIRGRSGLNMHLNDVTTPAEAAKKDARELRAIASAGTPEIAHCWVVVERHIKTDPEPDFGSFCQKFIKAKQIIKAGLGEPE
ncbi:hypothetical protein AgCh_004282 [Apium graveolens]